MLRKLKNFRNDTRKNQQNFRTNKTNTSETTLTNDSAWSQNEINDNQMPSTSTEKSIIETADSSSITARPTKFQKRKHSQKTKAVSNFQKIEPSLIPDELTPLMENTDGTGLINPKVDSTININCSDWLCVCCISKQTMSSSEESDTSASMSNN